MGQAAFHQHRQTVANLGHLAQGMRNEDHRLAGLALLGDDVLEQLPAAQVEPFQRFIEHEQLRFGEQGLGQGQALSHALAEAAQRLPGPVRQSDALEQGRHPRGQDRRLQPRQVAIEGQQGGGGLVGAERPGFRACSRHGPACSGRPGAVPAGRPVLRWDGTGPARF